MGAGLCVLEEAQYDRRRGSAMLYPRVYLQASHCPVEGDKFTVSGWRDGFEQFTTRLNRNFLQAKLPTVLY